MTVHQGVRLHLDRQNIVLQERRLNIFKWKYSMNFESDREREIIYIIFSSKMTLFSELKHEILALFSQDCSLYKHSRFLMVLSKYVWGLYLQIGRIMRDWWKNMFNHLIDNSVHGTLCMCVVIKLKSLYKDLLKHSVPIFRGKVTCGNVIIMTAV